MIQSSGTVTDLVRAFILKQFPLARERKLDDEESLLETGVIDSLGILEIISFIESKFGIALTDDEVVLENFASVAAIARFVQSKQDGSVEKTSP